VSSISTRSLSQLQLPALPSALAEDHRDIRHAQGEAGLVERAIASAWPRSSAPMPDSTRGIDQRDHRNAEPVRHFPSADRLA